MRTALASHKAIAGLELERRKNVLKELGMEAIPARTSWSHDFGESVAFDAWEHLWERDDRGMLVRYPLRTNGHYSLANSQQNPRRGHTRWQNHVDLLLAGKRKPRALVPVAIDPSPNAKKGAKGWRPVVVDGHIESDLDKQVWLYADQVILL